MFRHRTLFLIGLSCAALAILFFCDMDGGLSTGAMLMGVLAGVIAMSAAHWGRKALMDYPEADMRRLFQRASEESTGAGLALVAIAIVLSGLFGLFGPRAHAATLDAHAFVPAQAATYAPILAQAQRSIWPDHPRPEVLGGLVEQESCISLTHAKCWNPGSQLKTAREEGAGLGQITRAYRADGTLRFDSLADMRARYPDLQGWSWSNVYQRPDLQLRAIVHMSRENFAQFARLKLDPDDALAFADAAYNAGFGNVQADRRLCSMRADCDPSHWLGHVERACTRSHAPLYGTLSPCEITALHVRNVMLVRSAKYRRFFA